MEWDGMRGGAGRKEKRVCVWSSPGGACCMYMYVHVCM